jgi:hypothetical protein
LFYFSGRKIVTHLAVELKSMSERNPFLPGEEITKSRIPNTIRNFVTSKFIVIILVICCMIAFSLRTSSRKHEAAIPTIREMLKEQPQMLKEQPPFIPTIGCPNFLVAATHHGGIGHRIIAFMFALHLATEAHAALVLTPDFCYGVRDGDTNNVNGEVACSIIGHDSFFLTTEMTGMHVDAGDGQIVSSKWGPISSRPRKHVEAAAIVAMSNCFTYSTIRTGSADACTAPSGAPTWCFRSMEGAVNRIRPLMQALFLPYRARYEQNSSMSSIFKRSHGLLNVVWHIRLGDIELHAGGESALMSRVQTL